MSAETSAVTGANAPIFEVMRTMRAIRRLKPDPVPRELLEKLVEAATWAPSGGNLQAYSYVVVTEREQVARLAELWCIVHDFYFAAIFSRPSGTVEPAARRQLRALRFQRDHFAEVPAVIVACYDTSAASRAARQPRRIADGMAILGLRRSAELTRTVGRFAAMSEAASVYPGVQNLLLAARALGLGATLTTWHLALEPEIKKVLGIPKRVKTFAIIPVGWPRGRLGPVRRRPASEVIHRDRW